MKKQFYYLLNIFKNSRFSLISTLLIASMLIFACTRTILIYISLENTDLTLFDVIRIYGIGTIYDLVFLFYAMIPLSLYLLITPNRFWNSILNRFAIHTLSFITVYALFFILVAEITFWLEFQVRFNFISVDYLIYRREVTDNIVQSYPVYTILTVLFIITSIIYVKFRKFIEIPLRREDSVTDRCTAVSVLCLLAVTAYVLITPELMKYSENNYQNELAGNGPYQFFSAFRNNELDYYQFYKTVDNSVASKTLRNQVKSDESEFVSDNMFDITRIVEPEGATSHKLNIMLVMVESLSADFLSTFGNKKNLTPNLDKFANESLLFTRFYATGTRTTRGLEAVTLSIPPTPGRSIVKRLGREKNMWSLGNVLKANGYDTKFLYGGRGYFENMNEFFSGNGYSILDQSTVSDESIGFENAWGMADEYLYTQAIKSADSAYQKNKPFFYHMMTTSNHRPYTYPDGRIDIASPGGRDGAVKYTDWAIGDFVERSKDKAWFNDTLFVFVADHTAGGAGKTDLPVNRYHIPLIIYSPKHIQAQHIDKISSQIDLAPTLLSILDEKYSSRGFGKNILTMHSDEERALIGNYQHLGLYTEGLMSILSPKKKISQIIDPESKSSSVIRADVNDPHMLRTFSYYQGASYIYKHKINRWDEKLLN